MGDWRYVPPVRDGIEDCKADILDKWDAGYEEYGDWFRGDPLDHAEDEVYDLLFYLKTERQRINQAAELLRRVYAEYPREPMNQPRTLLRDEIGRFLDDARQR